MTWQPTNNPRVKKYTDARTGKPRYLARYRKPDGRQTMKRGFTTKRDAEAWLATTETAKHRGEFIEESAGRVRLTDLAERWLKIEDGRTATSTYIDKKAAWENHVKPIFGHMSVGSIRTSDIEIWVAGIKRSPTVVRRAHGVLASILDLAVKDRLIHTNPARGVTLPRQRKHRHRYLTHAEVQEVLPHVPERYRLLIELLAYTGLRWGEATALTVGDVDGSVLHIVKSVSHSGGTRVGGTKSGRNRRVVMPSFIATQVEAAIAGRASGDLLFPSPTGAFIRSPSRSGGSRQNQWWARALDDAGVEYLRPHDLRHTAASLAVQSGAHVKVVQRMLGHASATLTLDVYSDLFEDDLVVVAEALESAREVALGDHGVEHKNPVNTGKLG